jgi:hypothetical protein
MLYTHVRGILKLVLCHRGTLFVYSGFVRALVKPLVLLAATSVNTVVLGAHL